MANKAIRLKEKNDTFYPCPYYPVGSIYISVINENPSKWFGGTWVSFGAGRVLVGVDASQSEFNAVQKTGGAKTVTLTVNQIPNHSHTLDGGGVTVAGGSTYNRPLSAGSGTAGVYVSSSIGGGQAHNNLQPYITVYFWRRTA